MSDGVWHLCGRPASYLGEGENVELCKVALNKLFPVTSPFAEQFGLVLFSWSEMQSVRVLYILLLTAFDGVSS